MLTFFSRNNNLAAAAANGGIVADAVVKHADAREREKFKFESSTSSSSSSNVVIDAKKREQGAQIAFSLTSVLCLLRRHSLYDNVLQAFSLLPLHPLT